MHDRSIGIYKFTGSYSTALSAKSQCSHKYTTCLDCHATLVHLEIHNLWEILISSENSLEPLEGCSMGYTKCSWRWSAYVFYHPILKGGRDTNVVKNQKVLHILTQSHSPCMGAYRNSKFCSHQQNGDNLFTPPKRQQSIWQKSIAPDWRNCLNMTLLWQHFPVAIPIPNFFNPLRILAWPRCHQVLLVLRSKMAWISRDMTCSMDWSTSQIWLVSIISTES